MARSYWLANVLLESGFICEGGLVTKTITENSHILVEGGKFTKIIPAHEVLPVELPVQDSGGLLMLPGFQDKHIHLDKTYYGGKWKACTPFVDVFGRMKEEEKLLPFLLHVAEERAKKILELLLKNGVTHIRAQCNVDPIIGLKNMEAVLRALKSYDGQLSYELVAFPQHGLLRSNSVPLVREALRMGATAAGGLDPAIVDENIEASLHALIELAVEADADIDLHLHEPGHLGIYTMKRLAKLTEEAGWQGRVTIGHAFGLGDVPFEVAADAAETLAQAGISIASTVPIDIPTIPIPLLHEKGINVSLVNDSITDHWDPFGTGDVLYKASLMAERFAWIDEWSLGRALGFITGGKMPLNSEGERVWPTIGDNAEAVFVEASCSAEAVARRARRLAVLHKGKIVSGSFNPILEKN